MEAITLAEERFFKWVERDKSVSLRASGASYGGGSEVLVIQKLAELSASMTTKDPIDSMSNRESW